jgi:hypothetical protein
VRLWLNGQLAIDNWTYHAPTENSTVLAMNAGQKYDIMIEYFQGSGGAIAKLLWSSVSTPKDIVPQSQLYSTGSTIVFGKGAGLRAYYYNNADLEGTPSLTRIDPRVDFNWDYDPPAPQIDRDSFSVRWVGQIQPLYSETYTFHLFADDGMRLWVNQKLLIDAWLEQAPTEHSATVTLVAGQKYDILIEYYENDIPPSVAQLLWSSASTPKQFVPESQLYPTGNTMLFGSGNGLLGRYYNTLTPGANALLSRIDPTVAFDWGTLSPGTPVPQDHFNVVWTGGVQGQFSETYTFYTRSDDGVRLWVNDQLLIDNWTDHGATENTLSGNSVQICHESIGDAFEYGGEQVSIRFIRDF